MSVVAFDFQDTRVRGRRIPGFVNFPELNLRIYVRQGDRRGVTFVREFVPSRIVAAVARLRFNEPYRALDMESSTAGAGEEISIEHRWRQNDREQRLHVVGSQTSFVPAEDGEVAHFTKHRWGFGTSRRGELIPYRVEHPTWSVREVRSVEYDIDYETLYGSQWKFLSDQRPVRTILAVGSAVQVFPPGR